MKNEIVILGGGIASLGASYRLIKDDMNPMVIEKSSGMGGLASSYEIGNFHIERFYHHLFPTDSIIFNLAKELGIKNRIIWKKTKMGFYCKNNLYGFTSPLDLLLFKPLKFADRIRFGMEMLKIAVFNEHTHLDNVSAKKWLIRTFGRNIYEKIFEPMLKIKFAMSIDDASAAFVYGRLRARAKSRSRSMASERLGYMIGGYDGIIDGLRNKIKDKAVLMTDSEILEVEYGKAGSKIKIRRNGKIEYIGARYVINTLPLEAFAKIAKNFPKGAMRAIKKIKYQAVICATIGLKKWLSGYYWINISSEGLPFHGMIEHTNFIPGRYYGGNSIVYLFNYTDAESILWKMKEGEIKKLYLDGLFRMFPKINEGDVLWFRLSKERYATPIFLRGYEQRMKRIKNLHNFFFAGSFKIYPYSRNINNVIKTGFDAAEELLKAKSAP
jgi:protoporphyrinogen oxidase